MVTTERFEAYVGADIKEFQRKMRKVDQEIRDLATGVDVDLDLATADFYAEMQAVQRELEKLDNEDAMVEVELAYKEFMRDLMLMYSLVEQIDDKDIDVEVDAIINDFRRKLLQAKALAQDLDSKDIDVDVYLDTKAFYRNYLKVSASIALLRAKDIWVTIKADYQNFQHAMGRIVSQMRNWGEIFGTMFTGALTTMVTTLPAMMSSLVGLIGSLGVMVGVLAGQFMILTSALSVAALGFVGLGAVAFPTIQALFDETVKLNAAQQQARDAWDGFVAVYDELVAKTEGAVLQAFTSAMQGATQILQALEPMILSVADRAARLMDAFNQSIDSAPIQAIFDTFNQYGARIFENVTAGIGHFIAAIGSMIAALTPAAATWSENFHSMMESFAAWADGLSENEKFQAFIAYVQAHMPIISQIFADLIVGIIEFFSAFSGMASGFMLSLAEMVQGFREWASTLEQNQQFQQFLDYIREATPQVVDLLKNLWQFLINLGVAMAPFGAIVLDLVNKFLLWINSMMETHSWFSKLIGSIPLLVGSFMMLTAPIVGLVTLFGSKIVTAISAAIKIFGSMGSAISKLIPHFAFIIDDVTRVIGVVTNLASKALPLLVRGLGLLTGPIGIVITIIGSLIAIGVALYKNWDTVKAYATKIWTAIANFFSTTVAGIYDTVVGWFSDMWDGIVEWMSNIVTSITNGWNRAVQFLSGINLYSIGIHIIQGLLNGISEAFGWVREKIQALGDMIPTWLKKRLGIHSPSRVMAALAKWVPAGVAKGILDNVNLVKTASQKMSNAITLDFSKEVNQASATYKNLMNTITQTSKDTIKRTLAERYDAFESALSDHKKFNHVSASYEQAYWLEVAKQLKDGTAAKRKALENANQAYEQMLQEQYEKEVYYIDQARAYNVLSLAEQISAYEEYMKQYKVGSEQQLAYEQQLYDAKKSLYDSLTGMAENYLSEVQAVYDKLADEEQKLRDEWQKTYEARRDTLANTWGAFDKVSLTDMSEVDIVGNMREQVQTLSNWMHDVFRLESFGLDENLLNELRELGPKAAAEIHELANLSAIELAEYERLWKAKMDLAGAQATKELAGARVEMENEITKLRENAVKEIEQLKQDMLKEVDEMVNGSTDSFDLLNATLPEIGKKAMQGFIDGFKSMRGSLTSTLQSIANDVSNAMTGILMGERLNAASLAPSLSVSSHTKVDTSVYNEKELVRPVLKAVVNQMWSGHDVKTWIDEEDAIDARLNVKKRE